VSTTFATPCWSGWELPPLLGEHGPPPPREAWASTGAHRSHDTIGAREGSRVHALRASGTPSDTAPASVPRTPTPTPGEKPLCSAWPRLCNPLPLGAPALRAPACPCLCKPLPRCARALGLACPCPYVPLPLCDPVTPPACPLAGKGGCPLRGELPVGEAALGLLSAWDASVDGAWLLPTLLPAARCQLLIYSQICEKCGTGTLALVRTPGLLLV